jgi:hypothetical protein
LLILLVLHSSSLSQIEKIKVKSGKIDEKHDSFHFGLVCSKYEPDPEPPKPKPPIINKPIITRPPSPPPVIKEKSPPPKPKPIETTKPIVKPTPPPPKKESEEPNIYVEELQVMKKILLKFFYFHLISRISFSYLKKATRHIS